MADLIYPLAILEVLATKAKLIMSHLRQSNDAKKRTRKLRSIAIPQLGLPLRCDIQIGVDFSTNSLTESY